MMFARDSWVPAEPHQEEAQCVCVCVGGPSGFLPRDWSLPELRWTGLALLGLQRLQAPFAALIFKL